MSNTNSENPEISENPVPTPDETLMLSRRRFVALGALGVTGAVLGNACTTGAQQTGAQPTGAPVGAPPTGGALPPAPNLKPLNRAPLAPVPFAALPLGSIKARGWLLRQLELQRDGLTGNAEEILPAAKGDSAWLGGTGEDWEKGPYYVKGLLPLAYTLDDAALKTKVQKWVDGILGSQRADGFFGPKTNDDWWPRMVATHILRDFAEATNDPRVVPFLTKYYRHMNATLPTRPLRDWGRARAGDEMETVFWLYNRTGDAQLLELSDKLNAQAYPWSDIFTNNRFLEYGGDFHPKHNVNVPQAMKLPPLYWQRSKNAADRAAFSTGDAHLMREHGTAVGINTGTEFLSGRSTTQGIETCSIVERMLSDEIALRILGDASIGDNLEMMAFNALPAALSPTIRQHVYYTLPNNVKAARGHLGFTQDYDDGRTPSPRSGFPCCCYNFHMGWPKFVQNSWAQTADGGLAVLAYAPTQVFHTVGGVKIGIVEETEYPFNDTIRFRITAPKKVSFSLQLRIPAWCKNPSVQINGAAGPRATAGQFLTISREWSSDDEIVVRFPMDVQLVAGVNNSQCVWRGPLLYTLQIGEQWTPFDVGKREGGAGFESYEVTPTSPWNYALQTSGGARDFQVQTKALSGNPFEKARTPVTLQAKARRLPEWTLAWNQNVAFDPPVSPVASQQTLETVTLVPFGAQMLRVTNFPVLGTPRPLSTDVREDFAKGFGAWVTYGGGWLVKNGAFGPSADAPNSYAISPNSRFRDLDYQAEISLNEAGNAGLIFRASNFGIGPDAYSGYYVGLSAETDRVELGKVNGIWTALASAPKTLNPNAPVKVRVEARGAQLKIWVADMTTPLLQFTDTSFAQGAIGVRQYGAKTDKPGSTFSKILVKAI